MNKPSSRIARFDARIRDSVCPSTIAALVSAVTEHLDPEAIPALIGLLDHKFDATDSVSKALLRYGDAAEESLRAHVAADRDGGGMARFVLDDLTHDLRLRALGCF